MNGNLEICLNPIQMSLLKKSVEKEKIFLLLRSVVAPWNTNIQIFGAGQKEEMLTARGEKKKNQRPAVCYWFPVSVSPAWVCYDSFSFFFTEGGGRWSCVSFDVGFFFWADGDFFPAHYPFTNVSQLIVTFSNKKICEQNTQNVVPVSNMMLNDE